jgi:hypothetical protein
VSEYGKLPNIIQIWIFWTGFHTSPHFQISQKSFQLELRLFMHTDGWTGSNYSTGTKITILIWCYLVSHTSY